MHILSFMTCHSVQDVWKSARESSIPPHELSELIQRATAAVDSSVDDPLEVQHRQILDLAAEAPGPAGEEMQLPSNVRPSCSHGMPGCSLACCTTLLSACHRRLVPGSEHAIAASGPQQLWPAAAVPHAMKRRAAAFRTSPHCMLQAGQSTAAPVAQALTECRCQRERPCGIGAVVLGRKVCTAWHECMSVRAEMPDGRRH